MATSNIRAVSTLVIQTFFNTFILSLNKPNYPMSLSSSMAKASQLTILRFRSEKNDLILREKFRSPSERYSTCSSVRVRCCYNFKK